MDTIEAFRKLQASASKSEFAAVRLPGQRRDFLAKTVEGNPLVLLEDRPTGQYHPAIRLRFLNSDFQVTCRVTTEGNSGDEGVFVLVTCTADDPDLFELFIRAFDAVRLQLSVNASTDEMKRMIENLGALFRAFRAPSARSVAGLWAELFVIDQSQDPITALVAWRSTVNDRYDFGTPLLSIEVKATQSSLRAHEFNLEQLAAEPKDGGFVISILIQSMAGGDTITDLAKRIEARIGNHLKLREKLWANIIGTLGIDYSAASDRGFDRSYAEKSLRVFRMEDIPQPQRSSDARIISVRFVADCTDVVSTAEQKTVSDVSNLFQLN